MVERKTPVATRKKKSQGSDETGCDIDTKKKEYKGCEYLAGQVTGINSSNQTVGVLVYVISCLMQSDVEHGKKREKFIPLGAGRGVTGMKPECTA
jgi:hypothetical protein